MGLEPIVFRLEVERDIQFRHADIISSMSLIVFSMNNTGSEYI